MKLPPSLAGPVPADAVRAAATQRTLLAWIAWRAALAAAPVGSGETPEAVSPSAEHGAVHADDEPPEAASPDPGSASADADPEPTVTDNPRAVHRNVARRLRRWHARIVADWNCFDDLDDAGLLALRKRIKRQRYAVEFFAPLLCRRDVERYLGALAAIQDRMGALNDLFVARTRYQALATLDATALFALGWLAARIAELRALAKPELAKLARSDPPSP